jgi:hypothetical protein
MATIETTANNALHLNLIITSQQDVNHQDFYKVAENMEMETNIIFQKIQKETIRRVASYATKKEGIPAVSEYSGNTLNYYDSFRTAKQVMQSFRMLKISPAIFLTSLNNSLDQLGLLPLSKTDIFKPQIFKKLESILFYIEQFKTKEYVYSKRFGLINKSSFGYNLQEMLGNHSHLQHKKN